MEKNGHIDHGRRYKVWMVEFDYILNMIHLYNKNMVWHTHTAANQL